MSYTNGLDNPELYFQTVLYTGDGSDGNAITFDGDEDMQPDLVWVKGRGSVYNYVVDSVRGVTKRLNTDSSDGETTTTDTVASLDSDGFTLDDDATNNWINYSGNNYVAWCWKAGTSFSNDASATSVGTIDSSGSVSTDAGFSITTLTGTGANGTIAHGLSAVPAMIIHKEISADGDNWHTYHHKNTSEPETEFVRLNQVYGTGDEDTMWNDTAPTSSVYSLGTHGGNNESGQTYISYLFSEKQGFSKFGSYVGNGSADGTFVYTGFRPAFVLCKNTELAKSWFLLDTKRDTFNPVNNYLTPDRSNAEGVDDSTVATDFVSNGFKLRATNDGQNESGDAFIYMAFAEAPFVNSNGVPCNAR